MSVCEFGKWLKASRVNSDIGLRELSRALSETVGPISPAHLSRLENDRTGYDCSHLGAEKLWSLGICFGTSPLELFVLSRGLPLPTNLMEFCRQAFLLRSADRLESLGSFVRNRRLFFGSSATQLINDAARDMWSFGYAITNGFWSQIEHGHEDREQTISIESLWFFGIALKVCPLLLFALSRNLPEYFLSEDNRKRVFSGNALAA